MDKIEIIFLIIDIVEFFIVFFMAKALSKAVKEYNKKALLSISLGAVLSAHPKLLVLLIILAVLFFLTICELAYKTHYYNTREVVKKQKTVSVPYELYHYDGQVVDGVEFKERSNENDEILVDEKKEDNEEELAVEEREAEEPLEEASEEEPKEEENPTEGE